MSSLQLPSLPLGRNTPFLVVDRSVMEANIVRVHEHLRGLGLGVRPHVKTHKCPQIADIQLAQGAVGITVATVGETEVFARAGFNDIFIAYPVWIDEDRAARLSRLAESCMLAIGVDSVGGIDHLAGRLDPRIELMVEVDSGHHRTGCPPEEAGVLAARITEHGLRFRGVFTFPGHSYALGAARDVARQEADALARAAETARAAGMPPAVISGGSTPSVGLMTEGVATEARPGVYVFYDAQQWDLDRCSPEQIALTAYARVVSVRAGRFVLDAGSKVLGADRAPYATGYGRLLDHPDARIVQLSEHHAVVEAAASEQPELGDLVRVVPNHVCNAVNLIDTLTVLDRETVAAWPVAARGANS